MNAPAASAASPAQAPGVTVQAAGIVAALPRSERIRLVSGADFWNTEAAEAEGVSAFMLTDGPHGLRKQNGAGDHAGLHDSVPATCFPTASALGSTWDVPLLEEVGTALGRESRYEEVGVLLGPGLNIKRHPAGGRNFEYLSEDPLLSGRMAAALVRGIQSEGVGACLKHYAANNQESDRMRVDTIIDERTLREIYLTGFEIAVRESQPWTVMCAYNLINGEHAGESRMLLTEVLRDEWGFDGLVMTDWIATHDRAAGIHAGLDLEMPSSSGAWDARVEAAIEAGELAEADLDIACGRVVALALKVAAERASRLPADPVTMHDDHHALARRVAAAATTLLTNDGTLPLAPRGRIALVGAFAESPRHQGGGSSLVNSTRMDTALETMRARLGGAGEVVYAPGYDAATGDATDAQIAHALAAAEDADAVVLMVGLPTSFESEGYDRSHLDLPASHERLIQALTARHHRVVVALSHGAPVHMPWADAPQAIVTGHLGGQAAGSAIVDVLFGDAEPGGRLAESYPVHVRELPSDHHFANAPTQVQYREGLYVGYRFHDTFGVPARFPFGHGLSYASFEVGEPKVTGRGTARTVTVPVTNTGERAGSTVVQVYVHDRESTLHRPAQELKGFAKVHLEPGETADAVVTLDERSFAVYDVTGAAWKVEAGEYELRIGLSSTRILATKSLRLTSGDAVAPAPGTASAIATDKEFATMLGRLVPEPRPLFPFHYDSTIDDLRTTWLGRRFAGALSGIMAKALPTDADMPDEVRETMTSFLVNMPLRALAMMSEGRLSFASLDRLIRLLNATALSTRRAARR
ncbi:glycoside hydrolase family 3 C-terminal domain-containing protein [Demequina aestuarii]|uniref:glycoside hydrolase family 3 C-terminal domain-containing protein n=1 Tax=Demequina aestuarii TaxID=327095 RepID=UPI000785D59B|nr:glycoside hydrolase family 3 C-terminal domain-containing protein [Demequina aestuarii]